MAPFEKGWSKKAKEKKETDKKILETSKVPESPIHKAFYIAKENGSWNFVIATIQDNKVISRKVKDCGNKALSLEHFKIEFAREFYFGK